VIAEEVKKTKAKKSIKKLVNYIIDSDNSGEKVAYLNATNCIGDDIDLVVIEMEMTQDKNTRTKKDKTFHMVISFPPGEVPTREQLDDIEQSLAESVGMGHHQRISAAHTNTDNFHLHVAINKIDPTSYRMVNNYYYHKDMMKACTDLEIKHDLQRNERGSEKSKSQSGVEFHSGEMTLNTWCQENIKLKVDESVKSAKSWGDIHAIFTEAGLSLVKSGRGLVVQDKKSDTAIKASSVTRNLSLTRLEKTLGKFESVKVKITKQSAYAKERKTDTLLKQYQESRAERQLAKENALATLKETAAKQRLLAKVENQIKRQKIKTSSQSPAQKKNIYKRLAENNRLHAEVITKSYAAARKKVYADYGNMTFQQYLCHEAAKGDEDALARLRADALKTIKHQGLSGDGNQRITQFDAIRVDKHGVIAYQVGQHSILDNGKALTCKDDSLTADKQLLEMAVAKYGSDLTLNGSDAFKARILAAAEQLDMNVVLNGHKVGEKDPVQQFIANRNLGRVQNRKIMYHERYSGQGGEFSYQGSRNVGQQSVVLLKQGHTLYVREIPKKELAQYRGLKIGTKIDTRSHTPKTPNERGVELD
jgi:hypothetical protein